ncbi:MAG: hypothetical protein ACOYB2_10480 [Limnohabitans sp.]
MRVKREPNLLVSEPAPEEPNLWVARQTAVLLPLRRQAKDEALEGIREFLSRSTSASDEPKVSMDEVYPFRAIAASDGVDSYFTRQNAKDSLAPMGGDFAAGRSVLGNHDYGTFSYGSTTSGKVVNAEPDAPEYEGAFYPEVLAKRPELATSKWLVTDGYVIRGLDLNGNKSDSIIQGMRYGGIRRISISFTVGRYTCGIDGQDMLSGWFGDPEPMGAWTEDPEACMHFPGIDYGDAGFAYAEMHGNRALEESLVYMNASPSAMLMRKAAVMAERGALDKAQRSQVEARFGTRLPTFKRRIYAVAGEKGNESSATKSASVEEVEMTIAVGDKVRWTEGELQIVGIVAASAEDGRLTVATLPSDDEESRQVEIMEADVELVVDAPVVDDPEVEPVVAADPDPEVERAVEPTPTADALAGHLTAAEPNGHAAAVADGATAADMTSQHDTLHEGTCGHTHSGAAEEPPAAEAVEPARAAAVEEPEPEPTPETVTAAFVEASQRLAAFVARAPEAFSTADSAAVYGAERTIEQTLVDLSAERSVGGDVSRQHDARAKVLADVLGGDLTVTKLRTLMSEAEDGRQAKADLIRDTVAARVGVHGESFDAKSYAAMLQTQPMATVRSEFESWQRAKSARFTAGRSVVPREITNKGRVDKRAPARPAAEKAGEDQPNILADRK